MFKDERLGGSDVLILAYPFSNPKRRSWLLDPPLNKSPGHGPRSQYSIRRVCSEALRNSVGFNKPMTIPLLQEQDCVLTHFIYLVEWVNIKQANPASMMKYWSPRPCQVCRPQSIYIGKVFLRCGWGGNGARKGEKRLALFSSWSYKSRQVAQAASCLSLGRRMIFPFNGFERLKLPMIKARIWNSNICRNLQHGVNEDSLLGEVCEDLKRMPLLERIAFFRVSEWIAYKKDCLQFCQKFWFLKNLS